MLQNHLFRIISMIHITLNPIQFGSRYILKIQTRICIFFLIQVSKAFSCQIQIRQHFVFQIQIQRQIIFQIQAFTYFFSNIDKRVQMQNYLKSFFFIQHTCYIPIQIFGILKIAYICAYLSDFHIQTS